MGNKVLSNHRTNIRPSFPRLVDLFQNSSHPSFGTGSSFACPFLRLFLRVIVILVCILIHNRGIIFHTFFFPDGNRTLIRSNVSDFGPSAHFFLRKPDPTSLLTLALFLQLINRVANKLVSQIFTGGRCNPGQV